MEDNNIIDLYWARDEQAISETDKKYGKYCRSIAYNILTNNEDADECVNDTYMGAWNSMPPHRPNALQIFLGKITRRLSIDRWRYKTAEKRGGGQLEPCLDELSDCIPAGSSPERMTELKELQECYDSFIYTLTTTERRVFLLRYWYMESIASIAKSTHFTESKVRSMLYRVRQRLKAHLEKEGF